MDDGKEQKNCVYNMLSSTKEPIRCVRKLLQIITNKTHNGDNNISQQHY